MSAVEIMERLNMTHRPTFRKNYLNPALNAGVIEMILSILVDTFFSRDITDYAASFKVS